VLGLAMSACGGDGMEVPDGPDVGAPCDVIPISTIKGCSTNALPVVAAFMTTEGITVYIDGRPIAASEWESIREDHAIQLKCTWSDSAYHLISVSRNCP
jgi:hypothetical protein